MDRYTRCSCGEITMSWKDILKSSSSIRRNWINSKTPPDMYYYDKLNPKLKKEFDTLTYTKRIFKPRGRNERKT